MKKRIIIVFIVFILIGLFYFYNIHEIIDELYTMNILYKQIIFIILIISQIVVAFLPGEPLELASGYLFGLKEGTMICILGSVIGTVIVYYLSRMFKDRVIQLFIKDKQIKKMKKVMNNRNSQLFMFILFLIPGTPKDVMTYSVGLMDIKLSHWLFITTIGRIPSIITSTYLADMASQQQYFIAGIVVIVSIVLFIIGSLCYYRLPYFKGECKDNGT